MNASHNAATGCSDGVRVVCAACRCGGRGEHNHLDVDAVEIERGVDSDRRQQPHLPEGRGHTTVSNGGRRGGHHLKWHSCSARQCRRRGRWRRRSGS